MDNEKKIDGDHDCDCGGSCGDNCKCRAEAAQDAEKADVKQFDGPSIIADVERLIKCAQETILPYNELAYQTIINIVELTIIRELPTNRIVAQNNVESKPSDGVLAILDEVAANVDGEQ